MASGYVAAASLLLVLGCTDSSANPGRVGPSPEAFCAQLAEQACAAHLRCCRDPESLSDQCSVGAESYCREWADYLKYEAGAIVQSHVEYRPDLAAQLLETAEEAYADCRPFRAQLGEVFFAPRLSLGSRCATSAGCPRGSHCFGDGELGICGMPPDEVGASCAVVDDPGQCAGGLTCNTEERCMTPLAQGEPCVWPEDCASGVCESETNRCAACTPRDDGCAGDECSLWCSASLVCEASACVQPEATRKQGEPCESGGQCASGLCRGVCAPAGSSPELDPYCSPDVLVPPLWT